MMLVYLFLSVAVLLVPISVARWFAKGRGLSWGWFFVYLGIGAGGWILAKIPKAAVVLPYLILKGIPLQSNSLLAEELIRSDILFLILAAAAAGVFEEVCKPIGLLFFRKRIEYDQAVIIGLIVGIGAGVLEAINLLGTEFYRIQVLAQGSWIQSLHAPVERLLIIFFHGVLTALLVDRVSRCRYVVGFGVPMLIHFAIDLVMPYVQVHGWVTNIWVIQGILFVWVLFTSLLTIYVVGAGKGRMRTG